MQDDIKGVYPCNEQGISIVDNVGSNALWCCSRYSANNAWYVNANNGNVNTNNSSNRYRVLFSAELLSSIANDVLDAEERCYKNKHCSKDAAQIHYHLSKLINTIKSLSNNTWKPSKSIRFVITYPCYREIYCSNYLDRVVHHLVAPLLVEVAEYAHSKAGNVSHGNRTGFSAQTAAEQIRSNIYKVSEGYTKPCYIMTYDISGFFMNIDRNKAFDIFMKYYNEMPKLSSRNDTFTISLLESIIKDDATKNAEKHSPDWLLEKIPINKRLKSGKGLPIGRYPSQLIANLFISDVNEELQRIEGLYHTQFVDDSCNISDNIATLWKGYKLAKQMYAEKGLIIHPKKLYIQPATHGVSFCGRVIKMQRIYISNRTVGACYNTIRKLSTNPCLETAKKLCRSINSYFGLFSHCSAYNIQVKLANRILKDFGEWLYFKKRKAQLICKLKTKYKNTYQSIVYYNNILDYYETCEIKRRRARSCNVSGEYRWRRKSKKRRV